MELLELCDLFYGYTITFPPNLGREILTACLVSMLNPNFLGLEHTKTFNPTFGNVGRQKQG